MKKQSILLYIAVLFALSISVIGCGGGGGGSPVEPGNAPILNEETATVRPDPVRSGAGATIVLEIDYVDPSGTLNGGTSIIYDNQGNRYTGLISNASGISGRLITSFPLSPLVTPGTLLLTVSVQNQAGALSNTITISLPVV